MGSKEVILEKKDIDEMKQFRTRLERDIETAEKNDSIRSMGLRRKFIGCIGEMLGIIELHKRLGSRCRYTWRGKQKRGHDLVVQKGEKTIKVEIKSTAQDDYDFVLGTINFKKKEADKIVSQIRDKTKPTSERLEKINKEFDKYVEERGADLWMLVHAAKENGRDCPVYFLDKSGIKKLMKEDYRLYVEKAEHHDDNCSFGISHKTHSMTFRHVKSDRTAHMVKKYRLELAELKRLMK